jgi:3-keto-5-aminohexanoate cleavage enzyme
MMGSVDSNAAPSSSPGTEPRAEARAGRPGRAARSKGDEVDQPVIIEAAVNGVTSKVQNPKVPRTPEEIAADALSCLAAGAAIVHNHVDLVMVDGPSAAACYLECWQPVWEAVPGALLYPTVNAGPVEQSFAHFPLLAAAGCRIGIVDTGSVNLGGYVYVNSVSDVDYQVRVCVENRLAPSVAVFEPGFLQLALRLWGTGQLPVGTMIKLYFGGEAGYLGGVFGLPPTRPAFEAYMSMLEGCPLPWSVAVMGGDVVDSGIARLALERGGHLHTGLEDWGGIGEPTNQELVAAATSLCADVGRPIATHDETVALLELAATP